MSESTAICVHCQRSSEQVPLLQLEFNGEIKWICPQHLPILIHKPELLIDQFPGMDIQEAADHPHD